MLRWLGPSRSEATSDLACSTHYLASYSGAGDAPKTRPAKVFIGTSTLPSRTRVKLSFGTLTIRGWYGYLAATMGRAGGGGTIAGPLKGTARRCGCGADAVRG